MAREILVIKFDSDVETDAEILDYVNRLRNLEVSPYYGKSAEEVIKGMLIDHFSEQAE